MPADRAKVLSTLELKLKGKSLSKNYKENIATKWAERINTDEEIDSFIDERLDDLIEASSEADRRATEAALKAKGEPKDPEKPADQPAPTPQPKKEDDVPEWAKALIEDNKTLKQRLSEQSKTQTADSFRAKAKAKGISERIINRIQITDDFNEETALAEAELDQKEILKEARLSGFGNDAPPGGTGKPNGKKEASLEDAQKIGL